MDSLVACTACGLVQRAVAPAAGSVVICSRCESVLLRRKPDSLARTACFSLAALLLYAPANLFPVLRMEFHGIRTENTVWDGCVTLFLEGQWFIAGVVFAASIVIPFLKLASLLFLVTTTKYNLGVGKRMRTRLHSAIEFVGPWAMLDVFLLAILVSLVKLGRIATVLPGPGVLAFASVVILTILASASFDSRLIWETEEVTDD